LPDRLALLAFEEAIIVYGFCQNLLFSKE